MNINKSTDYSQFKLSELNRTPITSHVKTIKDALKENNFLHLHPIIVDQQMNIIDGQHRFLAAKSLRLPIFYIIGNVNEQHYIQANRLQRRNCSEDILRFYRQKGNKTYEWIEDNMNRTNLAMKAFCRLIGIHLDTRGNEDFCYGKLHLDEEEIQKKSEYIDKYLMLCQVLKERKVRPEYMWKGYAFLAGFRKLLDLEIDFTQFLERIQDRWFDLIPQANAELWFKVLVKIYNYRSKLKRIEAEEIEFALIS